MANKRIIEFDAVSAEDLNDNDMLVLGLAGGAGTRKVLVGVLLAAVRSSITAVSNTLSELATQVNSMNDTVLTLQNTTRNLSDNKVDKVPGKVLTTVDFTTSFRDKLTNLTLNTATTTAAGYMSAADKTKLNNVSTAANRITITHENHTATLGDQVASGAVATWTVNVKSTATGHNYALLSIDGIQITGTNWDKVNYKQWSRSGNTVTVIGRATGTLPGTTTCEVACSYYELT